MSESLGHWIIEGLSYGGIALVALLLGIYAGWQAIPYPILMPASYVAARWALARWSER